MHNKRKSYELGRGFAAFFEIFGWVIAVLGAALVLFAIFGRAPMALSFGMTGSATIFSGLLAVMMSQQTLATIETNTLVRAFGSQAADVPQDALESSDGSTEISEMAMVTQRGGLKIPVKVADDGTVTMDTISGTKVFGNLQEAQDYVS